ncbi:conserved hypothetical protein [Trichinella spiralis]|uniref:hypothetical protein n=1 Tax=Trichinella spiralis TaxID=6334 RepID=UPI0001EFE512|nr:conserved hypothetical protein [Trichinella spiralis]
MLTVNLSSVNVEQRTRFLCYRRWCCYRIDQCPPSEKYSRISSTLFYCNIICASYHTVMHFYALCKMRRCSESLESKSCEIVMMQSTFVIEMNLSWKMLLYSITRLKFSIR